MPLRTRRSILTVLSCALMVASLLALLAVMAAHHLTITGMTEESTGYRYFYSLRILYGSGERPWLPQGQLPGLSHLLIQMGLTLFGYSPTSLLPRIDVFAYFAAALPHVLAGAAFIWMAAALPAESILVVSGVATLTFLTAGYAMLQPDYLTWSEPVALITAGWLLRLQDDTQRERWGNDVLIGVFAGLCLAVKPTYVVFVLPIAIGAAFTTTPIWRACLQAGSSAIVGAATWIVVTWAYYLTDLQATRQYFLRLGAFVGSVASSPSWHQLLYGPGGSPTAMRLGLLMLIALATSAVFMARRWLSIALLAGSLVSLYVAYRRFEPQTFLEVKGYLLAASIVWAVGILGPGLGNMRSRWWLGLGRTAMVAATVLVWVLVVQQLQINSLTWLPVFKRADAGTEVLSRCLAATPGRTMFLFPNNNFRPTTVDSAIFKGGADIDRYYWGASKYVHAMFPDRGYAVGETSGPLSPSELAGYSKIVFVSLPGEYDGDVARLKTMFAVSLDQFDCSCTVDFKYHVVNACRRNNP
jgi:hypothetical protein